MTSSSTVYLDHNATTPLGAEARAAMVAALDEFGNPSSVHAPGRRARQLVESARKDVAALLGVSDEEIVFTSGGTEGDHLAIRGLAWAAREERGARLGHRPARVLSSALEHPAVHAALAALESDDFAVDRVALGREGEITRAAVRDALTDDTVLVTLAHANHELGNLFSVAAFAEEVHARGALFHTDAVQTAGRLPIDLGALAVDAATVSAHKLGGPKGVGAVFVRRGLWARSLVAGGHQERERRGGTENVPGIAGFGAAAAAARAALAVADVTHQLRDELEARLSRIAGARVHGDRGARVGGTLNIGFEGARGQLVVVGLDLEGVCASTGSACTSGSIAPSPVLLALGLPPDRAREAVRFSLGRGTTRDDIERAAQVTACVVERVRAAGASPV